MTLDIAIAAQAEELAGLISSGDNPKETTDKFLKKLCDELTGIDRDASRLAKQLRVKLQSQTK